MVYRGEHGAAENKVFTSAQIKSIFKQGAFSETCTSILHQAQEPKSGKEFVESPDGSTDFGRIDEETGKAIKRQAVPIRLQAGEERDTAKYGLAHIKARHGEKILRSGFTDTKEFVCGITSNWTEIRKGSAGSLFLVKRNGENDIAIVKLRPGDGEDFYTVLTAWRTKRDTIDKKKLLWERREPARSTSGVDPRLRPPSLNRPEGEPPNASSQSLTEKNQKLWERSEPPASASGQQALFVDTSSQPGKTLPTAQGQSLTEKTITASEGESKPKEDESEDLLYHLQEPGLLVTEDLNESRSSVS